MKTIKIKLEIDPKNTTAVAAFNTLLNAIGNSESAIKNNEHAITISGDFIKTKTEEKQKVEPKTVIDQKQKSIKETFKDQVAEKVEDQIAEKVEDQDQVENQNQVVEKAEKQTDIQSEIKLQDIRDVLGKKVNEHREVIKLKLTELGAKNVTLLDVEHYPAVLTFLNSL